MIRMMTAKVPVVAVVSYGPSNKKAWYDELMTKKCSYCSEEKLLKEFHKGNSTFGLKSQCIVCCKRHYNPEKAKLSKRLSYEKNKERHDKMNANWCNNNKALRASYEAKRRATRLKATPKWLSKNHILDIQSLYIQRKSMSEESGIMYHVDHIVPLISDTVCGLHVPWNLQIIPAVNNLQKSNKVK